MAFRCFFITKLFEIDELLARIIVQLRKQPDSHRIFSIIRVYYGSNVSTALHMEVFQSSHRRYATQLAYDSFLRDKC